MSWTTCIAIACATVCSIAVTPALSRDSAAVSTSAERCVDWSTTTGARACDRINLSEFGRRTIAWKCAVGELDLDPTRRALVDLEIARFGDIDGLMVHEARHSDASFAIGLLIRARTPHLDPEIAAKLDAAGAKSSALAVEIRRDADELRTLVSSILTPNELRAIQNRAEWQAWYERRMRPVEVTLDRALSTLRAQPSLEGDPALTAIVEDFRDRASALDFDSAIELLKGVLSLLVKPIGVDSPHALPSDLRFRLIAHVAEALGILESVKAHDQPPAES